MVWVKTTKGSEQTFVQDRGSGAGHSLTLGSYNCGNGGLFFSDDTNGVGIGVGNTTPLNDNTWHMAAGTFNASSGTSIAPSQFHLYMNGDAVAVDSCSYYSDTSPLTGLGGTVIAYHQAWNVYFSGSMANIQIYNASLSANDIQYLYREGIGGAPIDLQNLVGWWPLNGNAQDYSGNQNNGVAFNVIYTTSWTNGYTSP